MYSLTTSTPDHANRLREAYRAVGDRTWTTTDFLGENLAASRSLYTPESLASRHPRPRALEVYALVSGIPFGAELVEPLVAVQRRVSDLLGDRMHYWVAPSNLGVEYCVFKWPTDSWKPEWLPVVQGALASLRRPAFRFDIGGIQVNPDGCVVARGYDEAGALFAIREHMKSVIPFLPVRQSGWAHVPMGRILEPLGTDRYAALARVMRELADARVCSILIESMRLVHEHRWYMEEKDIVAEYALGD